MTDSIPIISIATNVTISLVAASLLGSLFLNLASKWILKRSALAGAAFITVLIACSISTLLQSGIEQGVKAHILHEDLGTVLHFLLIPGSIFIFAWVIRWRMKVDWYKATKLSLAVTSMSAVALATFLGIFLFASKLKFQNALKAAELRAIEIQSR